MHARQDRPKDYFAAPVVGFLKKFLIVDHFLLRVVDVGSVSKMDIWKYP